MFFFYVRLAVAVADDEDVKEDDGVAPSESVCVGVPVSVLPNDGEYVYPRDGDCVLAGETELVRVSVRVPDPVLVNDGVCERVCVDESV